MSQLIVRGGGGGGSIMAGGIGKGTALSFPDVEHLDAKDYVERELGLKLYANREQSLASAMTNPESWLAKRTAKLMGGVYVNAKGTEVEFAEEDSIKAKVANHFTKKLTEFGEAGYSTEVAIQKASVSANRMLEEYLEELEIEMPGASTVFASAAHNMANRNTRFGLATGAAESNLDEKAIYKRMRAAKKAKKAKRAAKNSSKNTA